MRLQVGAPSSSGMFRKIMVIALPIIVQGLVIQVQALINRIFLGHSRVEYLAAIGNSIFPYYAVMTIIVASGTGLTILVAQRLGADRNADIRDLVNSSFLYISGLALVVFAFWQLFAAQVFQIMGVSRSVMPDTLAYIRILSYTLILTGVDVTLQSALQGAGQTRPIMYSGIAKIFLNIVLDWLLIFGHYGFPRLGISGAALATTLSTVVSVVYLAVHVAVSKDAPFRIHVMDIRRYAGFHNFRDVLRIGYPAALEGLAWFTGVLIFVRILNHLDALAVGVYTMIFGVDIAVLGVYLGLAKAAMTLVGNKIGEEKENDARRILTACVRYTLLFVGTACVAFIAFAKPILFLFTSDQAIVSRAVPFFMLMAVTLFPKSMNVVVGNAIRGAGDTKWMLYTQLFGTVFVGVFAVSLVIWLKFGILGIYLTVFMDELIRAVLNIVRFYRRCFDGPVWKTGVGRVAAETSCVASFTVE